MGQEYLVYTEIPQGSPAEQDHRQLPSQSYAEPWIRGWHWTKNWPMPQCWWCWYQTQTRVHRFKECPEWKPQQNILWAEVFRETGRWKSRWKVRDLPVDGRCSGAVLVTSSLLRRWKDGFRSRTMREASARSGSYGSAGGGKWRGRLRRRSWVPRGNWVLGRSFRCSYPCPPSWHPQTRTRGGACFRLSASPAFFLFFPLSFGLFFFVVSLVRTSSSWDRPGRRTKWGLQRAATARTADRENG